MLTVDADRQDIIALNLQRAVQLCVDVAAYIVAESNEPAPTTMGEIFDALARTNVISQELAARM